MGPWIDCSSADALGGCIPAISAALLATEAEALERYLHPHQLAVQAEGGVEVMPHIVCQWTPENAEDSRRVLVDFDQTNARTHTTRLIGRPSSNGPRKSSKQSKMAELRIPT